MSYSLESQASTPLSLTVTLSLTAVRQAESKGVILNSFIKRGTLT